MEPDVLGCGLEHVLPSPSFTYSDHEFVGWSTAADGSGTSYAVGESYPGLTAAGESVTLYAQWKAVEAEPDPKPTTPDPKPVTPSPDPATPNPSSKPAGATQPKANPSEKSSLPATGDGAANPLALLAAIASACTLALAALLRRFE